MLYSRHENFFKKFRELENFNSNLKKKTSHKPLTDLLIIVFLTTIFTHNYQQPFIILRNLIIIKFS